MRGSGGATVVDVPMVGNSSVLRRSPRAAKSFAVKRMRYQLRHIDELSCRRTGSNRGPSAII